MARGSNNRFPQVVLSEQATPPTPDDALVDGEWLLYMDTDNKFYRVDHLGNVTEVGGATGIVDDTAYDATSWNGVTTVAPSKNAVRDKIESMSAATVPDSLKIFIHQSFR